MEVERHTTETKAAIGKVKRRITETEAAIGKVEHRITKTDSAIKKLKVELSEVGAQLQSPSVSADQKAALRMKQQQLLTEELELRDEELKLLDEKLQLRDEELDLRAKGWKLRKEEEKQRKQLEPTWPELYLKRARLMDAPSQISMRREQEDPMWGPLINDWRPSVDTTAAWQLPELIDPVFAKAAAFVAGGTGVDKATINTAAKLCSIGADIFDDEAVLIKAVRALLGPYLEGETAVTIRSGFAANEVRPDWALGDSPEDPSNLFLIVKAMTGIDGPGDPHFLGASYHLHFWRERADSNTFRNTFCPAFLLEVVGPHVRLSAVAWLDRVTIFPLTPLLNLLTVHPVTDSLLMPVARMLAALRTGVCELSAVHAAGAALQQPAAANKELPLPWPIRMDPRYDAAAVQQLSLRTYCVPLAGSGDGEGSGGFSGNAEAVVVKLYRSYGLAAHRAWADLGLAPKVLRAEALPAGWHLMEMEWLPWPEWLQLSDLQDGELGEALVAVKEALEFAHNETGMVHGDMRPSNCLVRRDTKGAGSWQVQLVDFKWAGREGEATYPVLLNPDVPWPEGVDYGKQLQRAHDYQLLTASTARQ